MDDATVYRDYHEAEVAKRDKRIRELEEAVRRNEIERDQVLDGERAKSALMAVSWRKAEDALAKVTAERDEFRVDCLCCGERNCNNQRPVE
jgi:hypothetical protein